MSIKKIWSMTTESRRLLQDSNGVILPLVAITLSVLIGLAGLGVEAGLWYTIKRQNQTAADMAALSGAMELAAGLPLTDIQDLATKTAKINGATITSTLCGTPSANQISVCECSNYVVGGTCTTTSLGGNAVEVVLAQQQSTLFARQNPDPANVGSFLTDVTIMTRAVATLPSTGNQVICSLGLDDSPRSHQDAQDISFSGTTTVTLGCGIASNSTNFDAIDIQDAAARLTATAIYTAGSYQSNNNAQLTLGAITYGAQLADPYAGKITYTRPSSAVCASAPTSGSIPPGTYCPMSITGNATLQPGVYYINGESHGTAFSISNGVTVTGTGVTIIATGTGGTCTNGASSPCAGTFNLQGGTATLSAPTTSPVSGIPSGILFYQDPAVADTTCLNTNNLQNSNCNDLTASSTGALTGVVYIPKTTVSFSGNNSSSGCLIVVALAIFFTGNSSMNANQTACTNAGVTDPPKIIQAVLAD
jgi:Flp pilus assembly protein TadG